MYLLNKNLEESLILVPCKDGVRFIDIKKYSNFRSFQQNLNNFIRLGEILSTREMLVCVLDKCGYVRQANSLFSETYGFLSVKELINKIPHKNIILFSSNNFMVNKDVFLSEESFSRIGENNQINTFMIKYPLYEFTTSGYKIIGTFSIGIIIGIQSIEKLLKWNNHLGLLFKVNQKNDQTVLPNLSVQENNCLQLMRYGKTAKMIAKELKVSHRTVEFHINNIKKKFLVKSKKELFNQIEN